MALQLIISAGYQKAGSILKVSVNGTYGWKLARPTYGYLNVTLIRLAKVLSSGPQYVETAIANAIPIGIESNGTISQDGGPSNPITISKRISSSSSLSKARVRVDVYKGRDLIASEFAYLS